MDENKLINLLIRHALASERYSAGLAAKIVKLLNSADAELVETIAGRYAAMSGGVDRGPATTKRLEAMLEAIRAVNSAVYQRVEKALVAELVGMSEAEVSFIRAALAKSGVSVDLAAPLPSASYLKTLVETTLIPYDQSGVLALKPFVKGLGVRRAERLEGAIKLGILQGETTDQLVKRIRGTKAQGYKDGILQVSRRSAQAMAITANSAVQNEARLETFREMRTIKFVEWSSVLDSRTSPICQERSGSIYPIDAPHPKPPAHPRCRSLLLPRRNDTDPPKHKTYAQWLNEQEEAPSEGKIGSLKELKKEQSAILKP